MEYLISNKDKRILVTNDTKDFMENKPGKLYIYGAGMCGYWVGYFLDRCGISYEGYIDRSWQAGSYKYNGKDIYPLEILKNTSEPIRIIISPKAYVSVMQDILFAIGKMDCVCLLPLYHKLHAGAFSFDINIFLGYFRKKLIKSEIPTILSNDCSATLMSAYLGFAPLTPTIYVEINPSDFIKLCLNPKKYLKQEVKEYFLEKDYRGGVPGGAGDKGIGFQIDDIFVHMLNLTNEDDTIRKWNFAIKHVNWNRLIYVFNENQYAMSYSEMQEFKKIEGQKLLIVNKSPYIEGLEGSIIHVPVSPFFQPDVPVERDFDVLEWLNRGE